MTTWRENLLEPLLARAKAQAERFDALPMRHRTAVLGGVVAIAIAAEFLLVAPTKAKRELVERAMVEQVQREADEMAQAEEERAGQRLALEQQLAAVDGELAQLGAGATSGQPLSFLLNRALARQEVNVISLRELMVERIVAPEAPAAAGAIEETPTQAQEAPTLYRHRFEVTLGGGSSELIDALEALDRDTRPLRVERVRLSGNSATKVELAVTLTVVGTERSWLSI